MRQDTMVALDALIDNTLLIDDRTRTNADALRTHITNIVAELLEATVRATYEQVADGLNAAATARVAEARNARTQAGRNTTMAVAQATFQLAGITREPGGVDVNRVLDHVITAACNAS